VGGWLDRFGAAVFRYTAPWVWNILIEDVGVEPVHDAPRARTQADNLLTLAWPLPAGTRDNPLVKFVCGDGTDCLDLPVTDAVSFLGNQVRDEQHRPLVITTRTLRDFLEIGLRLLVLFLGSRRASVLRSGENKTLNIHLKLYRGHASSLPLEKVPSKLYFVWARHPGAPAADAAGRRSGARRGEHAAHRSTARI
jgi:hypothetical protein